MIVLLFASVAVGAVSETVVAVIEAPLVRAVVPFFTTSAACTGATVSTTSDCAVEVAESTPAMLCLAVSDQVPSTIAPISHVSVVAVATNVQTTSGEPILVAVTVTVAPTTREPSA